jgi:hypothetical protein
MNEQKRNAMAYALLKIILKENFNLRGISDIRREAENIAKETSFYIEEILKFADIILREVFEEQMQKLKKK